MAVNETVGINLVADTKSLRSQLREATQELAKLQNTAGASSEEIAKAAKRAAELKDRIGDAKDTVDAFNPDAKFKAFSGAITGVAGAFAGLQGALGLFGTESANVQKQLLKVQSALAFSEGLNSVFSSIDAFKNLGLVLKTNLITGFTALKTASASAFATMRAAAVATFTTIRGAIIATGVGILVVGLGLVVSNFEAIKNALYKLFPGLKEFSGFVGGLVDKFMELTGMTNKAEEALDSYLAKSARKREAMEGEIRVLEAAGASEKTIYEKKKALINQELQDYREKFKVKRDLSAEDAAKELKEFRQLKTDLAVLETEYAKGVKDEADKKAKEQAEAAKKKRDEAIAKQKAINEAAAKIQRDAALALLSDQERELKERNDKYQEEKKTVLKSNNKDLTNLTKAYQQDIIDINEKYIKQRLDNEKKALEEATKALDTFYKEQEENEKKKAEEAKQLSFEEIQGKITDIERKNELLDEDFQQDVLRLEQKRLLLEEQKNLELSNIELTAAERLKLTRDYADKEIAIDKEISNVKKNEVEYRMAQNMAYVNNAQQLGQSLQQLAGQNKELAILGIVIEQAAAIGSIAMNAQKNFIKDGGVTSPIAWFGLANAIASGISALAAGNQAINNIKNGSKSASAASASAGASAPIQATYNPAAPTELDQKSLNTIQNVVARAYVVESDITGTQKRIKRIENAARI